LTNARLMKTQPILAAVVPSHSILELRRRQGKTPDEAYATQASEEKLAA
jgi:hypothetical protein